jgi:hypothetical protein
MKMLMLILLLLLSGCFQHERIRDGNTVQEGPVDPEKLKTATLLAERINKEIDRLTEEQMEMLMMINLINRDIDEDAWIRADPDRVLDPREVYRF